jgi:hypothetical protein
VRYQKLRICRIITAAVAITLALLSGCAQSTPAGRDFITMRGDSATGLAEGAATEAGQSLLAVQRNQALVNRQLEDIRFQEISLSRTKAEIDEKVRNHGLLSTPVMKKKK